MDGFVLVSLRFAGRAPRPICCRLPRRSVIVNCKITHNSNEGNRQPLVLTCFASEQTRFGAMQTSTSGPPPPAMRSVQHATGLAASKGMRVAEEEEEEDAGWPSAAEVAKLSSMMMNALSRSTYKKPTQKSSASHANGLEKKQQEKYLMHAKPQCFCKSQVGPQI